MRFARPLRVLRCSWSTGNRAIFQMLTDEYSVEAARNAFETICVQANDALGDPWLGDPDMQASLISDPQACTRHGVPLIRRVAEAQCKVLRAFVWRSSANKTPSWNTL